jgi:septum formation protein
MPKVILASQSPRRKELLTAMGVEFEAIPSNFDEHLDDSRSPQEVAIELANGKATDVADRFPDAVIIASDTIVTVGGMQLEKPRNSAEASAMLRRLAGTHNDVTTSLVVMRKLDGTMLTSSATTRVYFKPYDEVAVAAYVATGDPLDKAGAYGIQSGAAPLISHIEGHYDTVVGLPTHELAALLSQVGIKADPVELVPPVPQTAV